MDRAIVPPPKSSWFVKFIECLVVVWLVLTAGFFNLIAHKGWKIPPIVLSIAAFLALVFAIVYSISWHNEESRGAIDSTKRHAVLRGVLRYWLAFHISFYGFAKLMGTQLFQDVLWNNTPTEKLSGLELTWTYFGYSHGMSAIIAFAQIGGSILLLFRKTTLLGVCILLPVLLNIVLIDIFYGILGPLVLAILFTLELLFLLLLRWKDIAEVFLKLPVSGPSIFRSSVRWVIRCLVITTPVLLIYSGSKRIVHPVIAGKWNVDRMVKNRDTVQANAWLTDSSAWKTVYIDQFCRVMLCPNPYVYIKERSTGGLGVLDDVGWRLAFKRDGADSVVVSIRHYDGKHMQWNTFVGGDSVVIWLSRVE